MKSKNSPSRASNKSSQKRRTSRLMSPASDAKPVARSRQSAKPPVPYGPLPGERQLKWHELGMYAFVHFTMNTFTDQEWGFGDESPVTFNPTNFDADQIVGAYKDCGMKGVVLTCKHHDGFCLWPTAYTSHSVKSSPWKRGKGDMVKEFSAACRKQGLKFGVYLSPWDRNHKEYGRPAYVTYYRNQLRELLTNYGPIFEVWFDGANGGDGFYGGAKEKRQIDNKTYYGWANTWKMVRKLQPDACLFSDAGPDARWVGNESGIAGETCWATFNKGNAWPGSADAAILNVGERPGTDWVPAEVDVSIRPGWFYHAAEDAQVKTVEHLLKIYYESIGRGANLILNVPPDRRGLINEIDVKNLREWKRILDATFSENLASDAVATANNTRGKDVLFAPDNVLDGKHDRYWATDDGVTDPELVVDMGSPMTFNVVRITEYLPLGQRIDSFALDSWINDKWVEFAAGTSIGNQRLVRSKDITTTKVRLRITKAAACPAISGFGLFRGPV
ncbi:MAG: alpha-L-fucosidase [bacterium]